MIKRIFCVIIIFLSINSYGRVFFTGSNPTLSSFAFPQDIFLVPGGDIISFYTSWQWFPWWGDIDEPENRPYKQYVLNGQRTATSEHYADINQYDGRVNLYKIVSEKIKLNFDLTYSTQHLKADAVGVLEEGNTPYIYSERHKIRDFYLTSTMATYYKSTPVGFRLGLGLVSTSKPKVSLITENSTIERVLWGWRNENDYEYQDEFGIGSLFKGDFQAGFSKPDDYKVGTRLRLYAGSLDNYIWDNETQKYEISPKKIHNYTFRLYGIKTWYKNESGNFKFNTTALTRFTIVDSIGVRPDNRGITDFIERAKYFIFQVNPNVNIYPWKYPMCFIDAAILCNFEYMRYDFKNPDGSYIATWGPWSVEDYSWETFSYGRETFAEAALDIYAVIPVFGMKDKMAAVGISTLLWRRYKWMNKYFYRNDRVENIRKNFDKETWLNTVINIIYRQGKITYRLDFGHPLIYSLTPSTKIVDANGNVIAGKASEKMWLTQAGFKVGFFISTNLENIIKYRPFIVPESSVK
ncbi:MAG: hypothetical protein N2053_02815 [Chitinispirillaceae bacterium]|nr:hypothetical protein [Chitinispirillaceae bacterium]